MPSPRTRPAAIADVELEPPFDVRAWLSGDDGTSEPKYMTATVKVCCKPYLATRLNNLADAIDATDSAERSMADASPSKLRREYEAVTAEFNSSKITITLRQTVPGDIESVRADMDEAGVSRSAHNVNCWVLSRLMVDPALSPSEVEKLGERIGAGQFKQLIETMDELSTALPEVNVPKSLRP